MTFRWYGKNWDKIQLEQIAQIPGVTGIVGTLFDQPAGEVWSEDQISLLKTEIEAAGLDLEVIESVNVHEEIKLGLPTRDQYIKNYKQTIRNLGKHGIKVICYNFMPIFDWVKTDLNFKLIDGSSTLAFEQKGIQQDPQKILTEIEDASGEYTLPGWEPERLKDIKKLFKQYEEIDEKILRENLAYFLNQVIPVCEECGIKMAIHPDDPPYSVFNLPRIVKNMDDLQWIFNRVKSESNCVTFCTGSFASDPKNNVYEMLEFCCRRKKVPFAHIRNVQFLENGKDFYESAHLSSYGKLDMVKVLKILNHNNFDGSIRPDHGRMIWNETGRPGYGLYDRALGASYLIGIWETLMKE